MHTLAGATCTFFSPAFATGLWLLAVDKLLAQSFHTVAVLYSFEIGCGQIELVTFVIRQFVIG
jgi:hypothetical protein